MANDTESGDRFGQSLGVFGSMELTIGAYGDSEDIGSIYYYVFNSTNVYKLEEAVVNPSSSPSVSPTSVPTNSPTVPATGGVTVDSPSMSPTMQSEPLPSTWNTTVVEEETLLKLMD